MIMIIIIVIIVIVVIKIIMNDRKIPLSKGADGGCLGSHTHCRESLRRRTRKSSGSGSGVAGREPAGSPIVEGSNAVPETLTL